MQSDAHERARFLSDEARIAGISPAEENWLRGHLATCIECALYEQDGASVVRGLRAISLEVDPAMNTRVQQAILARARPRFAPRWRWAALTAAGLCLLAVPAVREGIEARREAEAERAAAVLLEDVDSRVSRAIPVAMEPLAGLGEPE